MEAQEKEKEQEEVAAVTSEQQKADMESMTKFIEGERALIQADRDPNSLAMLMDPTLSAQAFKVASFLSSSTIIPKDFQRQPANVYIALHLAHRLKMDPIMCMQKMYIVHGRPAFEAQFQIALVDTSDRFKSQLQWKEVGQKGTDSWGMIAYATRKNGHLCEGPAVTIGLAKAEGWYNKDGSKWKTSPELMLLYRSASWFARVHCPDVILGMHPKDELEDMGPTTIELRPEEQRPAAPQAIEAPKSNTQQTLELLGAAPVAEKVPVTSNGKKIHLADNTSKK